MKYKILKKVNINGKVVYKKINEFLTYNAAKTFVELCYTYNGAKLKIEEIDNEK